jgi:hypothetical protein
MGQIDYMSAAPCRDPQRSWNVQMFRSITSDSAVFDPARTSKMNSKKGRIVDSSITQAYIQVLIDPLLLLFIIIIVSLCDF